jgi:hypothetical protein
MLLFPVLFYGQKSANDQMSYNRYEGTIGENINVSANIVRLFEKLSGNYQYRYLDDDANIHFGKAIELSGEISEANYAKLKEFGAKDFTFTGVMDGEDFTGEWHAGENKKVPFSMKEYYPNGSLRFDVHYLHSEEKLIEGKAGSPVAEIEMTFLYPSEKYVQPEIVDSVRKIIVNSYFSEGFSVAAPDTMLVNFETEYFSNYVAQNENWHETGGASFNWEKVISMSVVYNNNYMLCLEYLKYAYSGGAHGMSNIAYDIIYLDNGQLLTFADVFEEGTETALSELLTKQLRKDYEIPDDVTLKEAGFFVDKVDPNRNIYVNGNGLGFLYNSYEIAPYAQGTTNIFLEFQQIKNLVKKGTPVYSMTKRF